MAEDKEGREGHILEMVHIISAQAFGQNLIMRSHQLQGKLENVVFVLSS